MHIYEVIIRPLETEKSSAQMAEGQYVFEVNRRANKSQIREAVEEIYGVDVVSVNTMNMPAKVTRMRGRRASKRRPAWKKAVVTVAPGERIEALEA
ncbi:MAG TPA: 50S ribosomal protein L23 [Chloroflexi bacterium]|nr:50S ribosomal protein L23 [Chloroflexota bacterium]